MTYQDICNDKQAFIDAHANIGISPEMMDLLHEATMHPLTNILSQEMETIFDVPPTFQEYEAAIKASSTNTAPGLSQVTNNALKSLPENGHKIIYESLIKAWTDNTIPASWKWRWLVPLQKDDEPIPTVSLTRPVMLIEALRKIWSSTLLQRIQTIWDKHNYLQDSQHAFRRGRSTTTVTLQFLSLAETALNHNTPLYVNSSDLKSAFDTITRPLQQLAWERGGVPNKVARWLAMMDTDGTIIPRTPLSEQLVQQAYEGDYTTIPERMATLAHNAEKTDEGITGFTAETGAPQGDGPSPLVFDATMDILLRALTIAQKRSFRTHDGNIIPPFRIPGGNGDTYDVNDFCYADDLCPPAQTSAERQGKANIISAFCAVFRIQLNIIFLETITSQQK